MRTQHKAVGIEYEEYALQGVLHFFGLKLQVYFRVPEEGTL